MKTSEYIVKYLHEYGIEYIFMIPGGGAMFLNDAVGYGPIKYVCTHGEQAATMAAKAYAQYSGKLGVVCVTTGCGGTNTITGVLDAYQDNAPILIISGNNNLWETIKGSGLKLKQFGGQEADILSIVEPITKYAKMVEKPEDIKYELQKAIHVATHGSPGPVWLDIPMNIQCAQIDETKLSEFVPSREVLKPISEEISKMVMMFQQASRPIVLVGQGVRLAKSISEFKKFIEENNLPVVASKLGIDILEYDNPLYIGNIGTKGDRAGNFAIQNSDLVLVLGSRLAVSSTSQRFNWFAREAKKIVVDINSIEHQKKTVKIDLFIECDLKKFFEMMNYICLKTAKSSWVEICQHWKEIFKTYSPSFAESEKINLYYFAEILSQKLRPNNAIVGDAGSNMFIPAQGIHISGSQRFIFSAAQTTMGFTLPACVGVSLAKNKGEVIGICGDGSFQFNIHELQTIKHHNLPVKIFVWNNGGYLTMRNTQMNFFKRLNACTPETGVSFPDTSKIANAYDIMYFKADNSKSLPRIIDDVLNHKGPVICEVMCLYNQPILTVLGKQNPDGSFTSRPLEDMYPFLDRKIFFKEMIINPVETSYD
jgi:acetolactate synthase-1/2/3 large subunit